MKNIFKKDYFITNCKKELSMNKVLQNPNVKFNFDFELKTKEASKAGDFFVSCLFIFILFRLFIQSQRIFTRT